MTTFKNWNNIYLVILGSGGVGKSAVTVRFVANHFIQIYDPTIEDSYKISRNIDGENFTINILDTAGQEEYGALRDQYIRQGEAYILVFSLTSISTFIETYDIRDSIYMILDKDKSDYIPICLCGNKKDLVDMCDIKEEYIKNIILDWNCIYREVSAKTGDGINDMFDDFIREILKHRCISEEPNLDIKSRKRNNSKFKCNVI